MLESTNQLRLNYNSGAFNWTILTFDENNLTIEIEDCDNIGCVKDVNFYER
jgi:hypothetical protein